MQGLVGEIVQTLEAVYIEALEAARLLGRVAGYTMAQEAL